MSEEIVTIAHGGVTGSVEWSEDDNCWHGRITGVYDLVTYEGKDMDELRYRFKTAVEDWHSSIAVPTKGRFKERLDRHKRRAEELAAKLATYNMHNTQLRY